MKNYKLHVYPSQVETALKLLVDLGYGENLDKDNLDGYRCEFIFTTTDGRILMGWNENQFLDSESEELTIGQLKEKQQEPIKAVPRDPTNEHSDYVASVEPNPFLKEYLTPDFRLMLASEPQDGWFEVPEGADTALQQNHGQFYAIEFYRGYYEFFSTSRKNWVRSMDWRTRYKNNANVVWQRDPQPEPDFGSDLPSSIEFASIETVFHYSASINTPRGTVSYDGVIAFPGRITGIEDYRKVRAEIAKDGNVTPEQVNVHSLTIVG